MRQSPHRFAVTAFAAITAMAACLGSLGVSLPAAGQTAAAMTTAEEARQPAPLAIAARTPAGVAGGGDRLWATDAGTAEILEISPASGEVIGRFPLGLRQPKGLAYDGSLLWVADQATRRLVAFDPDTGARVRDVVLQIPPEKGYRSVEALAWDGGSLWTAIAAGFSSSFNQVDPRDGRILRSLFADCDPRGIAVVDQSLYSLCFNGDRHPATLDVRTLSADDGAVTRSRRFLRRIDPRNPSGLLAEGESLRVLDATGLRTFPREPGAVKP
jgi:hypothetical protein